MGAEIKAAAGESRASSRRWGSICPPVGCNECLP